MTTFVKKHYLKFIAISAATLLVSNCALHKTHIENPVEASFYKHLQQLCGKTFVGATVYPEDPSHDFAGKKLVAHFKSCTAQETRIPFTVGEDKSRTWIISNTNKGLLLKHDHRHKDGTPDEITMYGGYAGEYKKSSGSAFEQNFLADEHTAKLIPAAASNVWTLSYNPQSKQLTYYLERHQKPRYKAVLELSSAP